MGAQVVCRVAYQEVDLEVWVGHPEVDQAAYQVVHLVASLLLGHPEVDQVACRVEHLEVVLVVCLEVAPSLCSQIMTFQNPPGMSYY